MKKIKFLPSILMLVACVAILCVGVFSLTPTENTIGGTINISSMARVRLSCYVNEELVYSDQNTAYGIDWDLTETALDFDVSDCSDPAEVPLRTIRIHIQNLTGLHLGVYFYNGQESTLQTIDGEKYATYDSLQLSDAVYKANAEETDENKLIDIYLSPYGYIAPANSDNTYDEYDMFINFDVVNLDIAEVSKVISYMLRIEEYQSNVTIDGSNNASFTPLEGRTKQLVKLPTTNTNTTVPTLADATYGGVVIPTTYTTISQNSLKGCTSLTNLSIPQSISYGDRYIFQGMNFIGLDVHAISCSFERAVGFSSIQQVNIGSFVRTLLYEWGFGVAKNVHISFGITSIYGHTFETSYGQESVMVKAFIPTSVIEMDKSNFDSNAIVTLTLPGQITTSDLTFGTGLRKITILSDGVSEHSIGVPLPTPTVLAGYTSFLGWSLNGDMVNLLPAGTIIQSSASTDNVYIAVFA